MEDLSKIVEILAANNQKLRVAVTKTSAQGEEAQKTTPNMMSFSNDENSIWFNGKLYGALFLHQVDGLTNESTNEEIIKVIGAATEERFKHIHSFITNGGLIIANDELDMCYCIANSDDAAKNIRIKWLSYKTSLLYRSIIFTLKNNSWSCYVIKRELTDGLTADIYKSTLETSIQMPNTVGGIAAGTTVATLNGKKQNEIIDMLLFPEQQPQVVAPSATILLSSGFINNEIMEVGMAAPVAGTNIKTAFNQGYGRVAGQPDKKTCWCFK